MVPVALALVIESPTAPDCGRIVTPPTKGHAFAEKVTGNDGSVTLVYVLCNSKITGPAVPFESAAIAAVNVAYVPVGPTVYVPAAIGVHASVVFEPWRGEVVL